MMVDRRHQAQREEPRLLARREPAQGVQHDTDILTIEGLSRRFGAHEVVRSLDLTAEPGERIALRGPNGSGKTTVLRCIAGTVTPDGGWISIGGHPAGSLDARRLVGASFSQERSFYLRLTGHDNLLFFARLRVAGKQEALRRVEALEEELELAAIVRERVDRCSTGMIQQLALARALLGEPRLLLLDEPTRSLDHDAVERLWAALDRRREWLALVIATHRPEDLEHCEGQLELPV
jgi:ABC-type multidrug transport system ATPase subunit